MDTAVGRKQFPGELALLAGLLLNSFAVTLIIKSGFGISVVSGVPYVISLAVPRLSLGVWNTLAQCAWMLVLIIGLRRFRPGYIISFALAFLFGYILDFWALLLAPLPVTTALRFLYFAVAFVAMTFGVTFFIRCGLPVLPFDTVPREFILVKGVSVRTARTVFDLINLVLMLFVGLVFLGYPAGIGVGTIFNALLMGAGSGYATRLVDRHLEIRPRIGWLARLA